jgi:hypothetical protein
MILSPDQFLDTGPKPLSMPVMHIAPQVPGRQVAVWRQSCGMRRRRRRGMGRQDTFDDGLIQGA